MFECWIASLSEFHPVTPEVAGSSPVASAKLKLSLRRDFAAFRVSGGSHRLEDRIDSVASQGGNSRPQWSEPSWVLVHPIAASGAARDRGSGGGGQEADAAGHPDLCRRGALSSRRVSTNWWLAIPHVRHRLIRSDERAGRSEVSATCCTDPCLGLARNVRGH
jgi:hypothetical protein